MLFADYSLVKPIHEQRIREFVRERDERRLKHLAGIDRQGLIARPASRLLPRLGHLLVAWGRRLERRGAPPTAGTCEATYVEC